MGIQEQQPRRSWRRLAAAVLVGLVGSILIWVATPYNNFIIEASYIADSYLPPAGLFVALVLVLGVNPLLRRVAPRLAPDRRQMAIILGMLLVACVLPGQGLLRLLPYSIGVVPRDVRTDKGLAEAYKAADLPPSLFPDKIGYQADTPVSDYFITELPAGEAVPWSAWLAPTVSWGLFLVACWLMTMGLSLIVLPQWRRNERLPFPLLTVQEALIEEPAEGCFAPLFRRRSFWIAAMGVLVLHVLAGAKMYDPEGVPAVPLGWNLQRLFTEEPFNHLPGYIYNCRIYFIFMGMAFFMPTRMSFSIWLTVLAYAAYRVIGMAYFPPFYVRTMRDHRCGAMVALTIGILYLGRKHWGRVFAGLFRRAATEADRRDRVAAGMFLTGCAGMWAFMVWAGVQPVWAVFYVAFAFMVSILIARIVAETGMPFIRIDTRYQTILPKLVPLSWVQPATIYFSTIITILFTVSSRVSAAVMGTHALGLDRRASPRHQSRLAVGLVVLLAAGLVICGGAHLYGSYHHSTSIDGELQPISPYGIALIRDAHNDMQDLVAGQPFELPYNQPAHIAFGAALAGLLQWACMIWPKWPVHPIGLLMVNTFYSNEAWVSVMIGWLVKVLVLRFGGARLYRRARPLFVGLIMGEVFAAVFWGIEPAIRVLMDLPYQSVPVQPY